MKKFLKLLQPIIDVFLKLIGKIHWPTSSYISRSDKEAIKQLLKDNYLVILTFRKNHLSSYFVLLGHFLLTGKWGKWSHVLMNLEDDLMDDRSFRIVEMSKTIKLTARERVLIEAIGEGVVVNPFEEVFDVQRVALMKPKKMTLDEWRTVLDTAKEQLGKPYDTLFDIADDRALSCVELVRRILMAQPNYHEDFVNFERLIQKEGNLTPQMFYDCGDFEVIFKAKA